MGGGKGGSSTTNNNYRPLTEAELEMQNLSTGYARQIMPSAFQLYNTGMAGLNQAINPRPDYNTLYATQAAATAQNTATANDIANGILPQSYADNRNAQAQRYAQESVGNLLGDLNARGVINSSVMNSGMEGINRNLANTFQNSYTSDLQTASGLLGQAQNMANMPISQAAQAEQASYDTPLRVFSAATGQAQPATNIWQPTLLSNQANPTSSTQTTSGGGSGLFGGLLGVAGNALGTAWGRRW